MPRPSQTRLSGRCPFRRDCQVFDYDYDSEAEWEQEVDGENLSDADDGEEAEAEKEGEANYEVDDWLCEDDEIVYKGCQGESTNAINGFSEPPRLDSEGNIIPHKYTPKSAKVTVAAKIPQIVTPYWFDHCTLNTNEVDPRNSQQNTIASVRKFRCSALVSLPFTRVDTFSDKLFQKSLVLHIHEHVDDNLKTIMSSFMAKHPDFARTASAVKKAILEVTERKSRQPLKKKFWLLKDVVQKEYGLFYLPLATTDSTSVKSKTGVKTKIKCNSKSNSHATSKVAVSQGVTVEHKVRSKTKANCKRKSATPTTEKKSPIKKKKIKSKMPVRKHRLSSSF